MIKKLINLWSWNYLFWITCRWKSFEPAIPRINFLILFCLTPVYFCLFLLLLNINTVIPDIHRLYVGIFRNEASFEDYVRTLFSPNRMLHFVSKRWYTSALCERGLPVVAIMVSSLWAMRFYAVFIIQFSCISGIFKRLFNSFEIKKVSLVINLFNFHFL